MQYEKPAITDLGSIADHTFGEGRKGDNGVVALLTDNNFDEPKHS